jgi:hypothetical protein
MLEIAFPKSRSIEPLQNHLPFFPAECDQYERRTGSDSFDDIRLMSRRRSIWLNVTIANEYRIRVLISTMVLTLDITVLTA